MSVDDFVMSVEDASLPSGSLSGSLTRPSASKDGGSAASFPDRRLCFCPFRLEQRSHKCGGAGVLKELLQLATRLCLVRLDHILETPRMGVDGERGLQHKGQRPIQRTRSAWRRRQTCARVQCSVSVICALTSVRFRPDRLFCTRRFLTESGVAARCSSSVSAATAPC